MTRRLLLAQVASVISCAGLLLAPLAQAAYSNTPQSVPDSLNIKYSNIPPVYFTIGGCKRGYGSYEMFKNWNGVKPHILILDISVLIPPCGSLETAVINQPRLGTVFKKAGESDLYVMTLSGPYHFTSKEDFSSKGYLVKQVQTFTSEDVKSWGENQLWSRPEGTLFRYKNSAQVYQLSGGQKMPFTSMKEYDTLYASRNYIMTLPDTEQYPTGGQMLFGNGYVVKGSGSQVYLTSGNQFRPFATLGAMQELGFGIKDIIRINDSELTAQSIGAAINE
jgi:hypothetical protein